MTNDSIPVDGVRAIVKLDAKRPTQVPGFAAAKPGLQQQLQAAAVEKASAQMIGSLLKDAKITQ